MSLLKKYNYWIFGALLIFSVHAEAHAQEKDELKGISTEEDESKGISTEKDDMKAFTTEEEDALKFFSKEEMDFILGEKDQPWNYSRFTIGSTYMIGMGDLADKLSYRATISAAFDQGIHHLFKPFYRKKSPALPGLRLEVSYAFFGEAPVSAISPKLGPIWLFPLGKSKKSQIIFAALGGMTFMSAEATNWSFVNNAFTVTGILGVEFYLSKLFISISGRFAYIADDSFPWMGAGGNLSIGYKFDTNINRSRKKR